MPRRLASVVFEVTQRRNHRCLHCYNAWKNPVDYPEGELPTGPTLAMLGKLLDQTGAGLVTLTGGEPLLRDDLPHIVDFLADRRCAANLITNGSLLTDAVVRRLGPGRIGIFELPLLSVDAEIHDRLSGRQGAFDDVTLAMASVKAAGGRFVAVFVATRLNLHSWRGAAELAVALGADGIMLNRFNPGGEGARHVAQLQADPDALTDVLDDAEAFCRQYDFPISCSIAMPPCLFDTARYRRLTFGFCAAGTDRATTMDPLGAIRPCNHSTTILGNIRDRNFWDMADGPDMHRFMAARPALCRGCKLEETCLGGCKAAAQACTGSLSAPDPFLHAFADRMRRPS